MNVTENKNLFICKIVYENVNSNKLFQLRWSCFVFCSNRFNNNNYFLCSFSTSLSWLFIFWILILCVNLFVHHHILLFVSFSVYTLFSNLFIFAKYSNTRMMKTWFSFYVLLTCSSALHSWSHLTRDFK